MKSVNEAFEVITMSSKVSKDGVCLGNDRMMRAALQQGTTSIMSKAHGYFCSVKGGDQVATRSDLKGGEHIRCLPSLQPRAANKDLLLQSVDVL